eukprot:gene12716-17053_t
MNNNTGTSFSQSNLPSYLENSSNFENNYGFSGQNLHQSVGQASTGNLVGLNMTNQSNYSLRMKNYGSIQLPLQTRHARRIYIGGIPPSNCDEDSVRNFVNHVISKGINEENDNSYVMSVYIHPKRCFAFVELKSIELATACLDIDGIIFNKATLKILRANEYKPDLVPPSMLNKTVKLDLSSFKFGVVQSVATPIQPQISTSASAVDSRAAEFRLDSLIQPSALMNIERESITVVGFPYSDHPSPTLPIDGAPVVARGNGCINGPQLFRTAIRFYKYGSIENPEYSANLQNLKFFDVGDVVAGSSYDETANNLTATLCEIIGRHSIPFIIGGSNHLSYFCLSGLMNVVAGPIGIISISAQIDSRILDDSRMYSKLSPRATCEGRYIHFATQGTQCSQEQAQYSTERGAQIIWLTKDLRDSSVKAADVFKRSLDYFSHSSPQPNSNNSLQVAISIDIGALNSSSSPLAFSSNSSIGLTVDELLEIVFIAGLNPNVALVCVSDFNPEKEDSRESALIADIFYKFSIGVSLRKNNMQSPYSMPSPTTGAGNLKQQYQYQPSNVNKIKHEELQSQQNNKYMHLKEGIPPLDMHYSTQAPQIRYSSFPNDGSNTNLKSLSTNSTYSPAGVYHSGMTTPQSLSRYSGSSIVASTPRLASNSSSFVSTRFSSSSYNMSSIPYAPTMTTSNDLRSYQMEEQIARLNLHHPIMQNPQQQPSPHSIAGSSSNSIGSGSIINRDNIADSDNTDSNLILSNNSNTNNSFMSSDMYRGISSPYEDTAQDINASLSTTGAYFGNNNTLNNSQLPSSLTRKLHTFGEPPNDPNPISITKSQQIQHTTNFSYTEGDNSSEEEM